MKKNLYITIIALCTLFTSCEKDEIGGTATEALAGQWYVVYDGVDADGEVTMKDPFRVGRSLLLTYNTSANDGEEIFVDDLTNFWEFKLKVDCNVSTLTFAELDESKYIYATTYDSTGTTIATYNNYYYEANNFDAENWAKYKADSISLDAYKAIAKDTISAGYFAKYGSNDFAVGAVISDTTIVADVKNAFNIWVTDGKILKGATLTPSGAAADSICFYVVFSDDKYVGKYWDKIRVSGYRYTGLAADD